MARPLSRGEVGRLLAWYARNARSFPWREDPHPYRVWLAEAMSQQTRMEIVLPRFSRFLARFPSVMALARASEDAVLGEWAGLGYYSRARNLHRAARMVARELHGRFPRDVDGWRALPGIGPYTAAAIASQAFDVPEPVWDGNVLRVAARRFGKREARTSAFRVAVLAELRRWMSPSNASAFNQAWMELGATVCAPRSPRCGHCPLEDACVARAAGDPARFPAPKPRKDTIELRARAFVLLRARRGVERGNARQQVEAYLAPRQPGQWFYGLWDFPSEFSLKPRFARRPGPVSGPAAARAVEGLVPFASVRHTITRHRIRLEGVLVPASRARELAALAEGGRWFSLDSLTSDSPPVPLATTARKLLRPLMKSLTHTET